MAKGDSQTGFRVTAWGAASVALVLALVPGALKFLKVFHTDPHAPLLDVVRCLAPDVLVAAASGIVIGALAWASHGRPRAFTFALAALETVWCTLLLFLSMLEHQGWERSGTLLDWKLLSYTLQHLDELSAIIGAESDWKSWLILGAVTTLGSVPLVTDWAHGKWPRFRARFTRLHLALGPSAIVAGSLLAITPASPRVHPFIRSASVGLLSGALTDSIDKVTREPAAPAMETSVLVKERLAKAPPKRTPTESTPENLLVVVLESTRWDATTVYDPELPTTPHMAKLAARGLVPETVYVDMPHTSKALVSILCGYPARWTQPIEEAEPGGLNRPCLAHILGAIGYSTAYFQSATGKFENRKRLVENFGYKHFRALENYDSTGFEQTNYLGLEDKVMTKPLLGWIDEQVSADKPFFATVLTTISHHDYGLPTNVPYEDIVKGVATNRYNRYLNTVKYADAFIGDIMAGLDARKLTENTLVVVVGDHGQAFFEHGRKGHNDVIWEEGLRVPLIVSNPRAFASRVDVGGLRRQGDLVPTALRLMGVSFDPLWFDAKDLQETQGYDAVISSCWYDDKCMAEHREGLSILEHFDERPMELYDLAADPKQQNDLLESATGADLARYQKMSQESRARMRARRTEIARSFEDVDSDRSWLLKKEPLPEHLVYVRFGDYVEVLGWDGPTTVDPGTFWDFTVYFRCLGPTPPEYRFFTHLETVDGRRVKVDHDPAKGRMKLEACEKGTLVRDHVGAYIPPTFPAGELTLWYGVFRKKDRVKPSRTSLEVNENRVALVRPRVTANHEPELKELFAAAVTTTPPKIDHPVHLKFGDAIELVELYVEPKEARRRSEFEVVATWHVKKPLKGGWRVFLHADPLRGRRVRQDYYPVRGLHPIGDWKPGTYIRDRYPLYISHRWGWPTGQGVKMFIGLYEDDERLSVTDAGGLAVEEDRVPAGVLTMIE